MLKPLAPEFPTVTISNITNMVATLPIQGDSLSVMPNATVTLPSGGITQVPNSSQFRLVSPTLEQLVEKGYVPKPAQAPAAPAPVAEIPPPAAAPEAGPVVTEGNKNPQGQNPRRLP